MSFLRESSMSTMRPFLQAVQENLILRFVCTPVPSWTAALHGTHLQKNTPLSRVTSRHWRKPDLFNPPLVTVYGRFVCRRWCGVNHDPGAGGWGQRVLAAGPGAGVSLQRVRFDPAGSHSNLLWHKQGSRRVQLLVPEPQHHTPARLSSYAINHFGSCVLFRDGTCLFFSPSWVLGIQSVFRFML